MRPSWPVLCATAEQRPPRPRPSPCSRPSTGTRRPSPGSRRPRSRLAAPRVRLGEYHDDWSFSPDGSHVALGMGGAGDICGRGICIVDVRSMTVAAHIPAPTAVEAVAWLRPRRIVGVDQAGGILVGDPVTGAVLQRRAFPFDTYVSGGRPHLRRFRRDVRLDPGAAHAGRCARRVRSVALKGIGRNAGLAAAPPGRRAFVFGSGTRAAEVNLRTMSVRYRRVRVPRTARWREALWLGWRAAGRLGRLRARRARARHSQLDRPDRQPRDQERAPCSRAIARLRRAGPGRRGGVGLRVHTRDGSRLVRHLFGERKLAVEVAGRQGGRVRPRRSSGRRAAWIVDARSGELIRRLGPPRREVGVHILGSRLGSGALPR